MGRTIELSCKKSCDRNHICPGCPIATKSIKEKIPKTLKVRITIQGHEVYGTKNKMPLVAIASQGNLVFK